MENSAPKGHPKGLYLLFTVEMWERFSYYGMRAIFILYLTKALLIDAKAAGGIFGTYTSLVYATPLLGGFIADRYWGNRRSILVGGVLMAIAQFLMFFSASMYDHSGTAIPIMYVALGFLIIGNGFFKPNISSMVGSLYPKGDSRIDSAYTIFYMGINSGALVAPLVCGGLGDTGSAADFKYGFLSAGIGMVIGTIIMLMLQRKYLVTPTGEPIGMKPSYYKKERANAGIEEEPQVGLTKIERDRIFAIFIITAFVIAFWAAFEQAGASLTIFADQNTDRGLFGWTVPASFFQSINPIFIIILAPLFSVLWSTLSRKGKEPSSPMKMVWGLAILALGYILIAFSVKGMGMEDKISMFFLIGMYFLHTCGELAISPVGLSVVNKLSPKRFASMMMAVFFLSSVVGNFTAGLFSGLIPQPKVKEVIVSKEGGLTKEQLVETTAFLVNKSENPMEAAVIGTYEEQLKASGKKLNREKMEAADTLNKKYATYISGHLEDSREVIFADRLTFKDSLKNVVVESGLVSKFEGNKNVIVRNVAIDGKHVGSIVFENSENSLFGFKINTLYSFFIIFIIMSGITSLLLFVLHKRVEKLMHGIR
ncbi:peptide MFS transporter [Fluviicola sp.]|uniref:peptide MFS transporter n=1 Tax=Fluviicola sp. TaxID=1917219 RepID=UPI00260180ED|nr:peptide MFS transporter [Fluviicola sp.]